MNKPNKLIKIIIILFLIVNFPWDYVQKINAQNSQNVSDEENYTVERAIALYIGSRYVDANKILSKLYIPENFKQLRYQQKVFTCVYYAATRLRLEDEQAARLAIIKLFQVDPNIKMEEILDFFKRDEHFPSWFKVAYENLFGSVIIKSEPPGAEVFVDNVYMGVTPVTIQRLSTFDVHTMQIKKEPEYKLHSGPLEAEPARVTELNIKLAPKPFGSIYILSKPAGAQIFVDDKNIYKTTDCKIDNIATGQHILCLDLKGYQKIDSHNFMVSSGTTDTLRFELKTKSSKWYRNKWFLGTTVGVIGGGIYYLTTRKDDPVSDELPAPPDPPE